MAGGMLRLSCHQERLLPAQPLQQEDPWSKFMDVQVPGRLWVRLRSEGCDATSQWLSPQALGYQLQPLNTYM